ncbi:MAG: glycosyltransferase family 4 protein [bacterium]
MNVLIFSITYFPFVGGAEVAVKEITDRIICHVGRDAKFCVSTTGDDKCIDFDLITAKLNKKLPDFEKIGNVNVYRVGWGWKLDKYFYPVLAFRKAVKLHRQKKYDIAQAIMANYAGLTALLFKLKDKNLKYLLTEQSGDSDFFILIRTWFWQPIYKMVYTKADFIQPISLWLEKRIRRYGYKGESRIVPNGVDVKKFSIFNSQFSMNEQFSIFNFKKEIKKKFGFGEDDEIIITVSRLVKKNGVEDLIRGLKEIEKLEIKKFSPEAGGGIKLLIAGTGKLENKLKKLVASLKLQNKVIFLGHIGHDELPKYLWASDIFCRPSLTEGFGNVFIEAMAAGVPVVATPVGGIPDFLVDGETGIFCKVENPKSIAECVIRLLSDQDLYAKIAKNGRRLVEERYDWENIAFQMRGIYKKLS